jgi:hypothetical protein
LKDSTPQDQPFLKVLRRVWPSISDQPQASKGDSVKVALAARLRAETTMTVGWSAERLTMGTCGYLNHHVYRQRKLGGE